MNTKQYNTKTYVLTALFAALIFLVTAYVLHIPTPATGGYIHLGDAVLYLAASILPTPLAVAAGGIGEAMSDAMTGSVVYAIPTFLIKSAMVLCFASAGKKIITKRNIAAAIFAGVICVGGYYLTESILYHSFVSPLVEIPANLIQAGSSAVIYILAGNALDRANLKNRISLTEMRG
ncbi:TIGR04002 family protein [Caproiciproducens galactitolivorans]|uniref:TIGR04002 family protein n=1 Tax=Caproiciproducens galactitolivorans TaxID=642589 RepID=A0ABT4BW12_9FIRM|nr:TIGR04002 family protein [Caproiciproducens galactitolivorans]MCY1714131.1 TIGR04002 family protein [Caproiciproducens galactitolivorans]